MVSDLVAWERMVQRLGRVNRRGEGDAEIHVFWSEPTVKDADAPTQQEQSALTAFASKTLIENLPQSEGAFDASPAVLRALVEGAQNDRALKLLIEAATTREPLRPALNRALVDAWSMTSLETHPGRPEVGPWLRGWVEDAPQPTIVWREHLPVREPVSDWPRTSPEKKEIEDFFEAAPLQESEKLEIETYHIASWLQDRAKKILMGERGSQRESAEDEPGDTEIARAEDVDAEDTETERAVASLKELRNEDIVALVLSPSGAYAGRRFALRDLGRERKGSNKKDFEDELAGKLLVIDARFGGLKQGLLEPSAEDKAETADTSTEWSKTAQFRVRRVIDTLYGEPEEEWRFEDAFVIRCNDEGEALEWLRVDHLKDAAHKEDARSIARPQTLSEHQDWTRRAALRIAKEVGLSGATAHALAVAAGLHDEGKRAQRWQRAFNAPRDADELGLTGPLAKTRGPIRQALLDGYRHEFGSLPYVEANDEFRALPADLQDLVLHLVAAHHGFARPIIEIRGCEDAPPSALAGRARDVSLRFARLQNRWGPWGLAWWEALLRAADAQASRENDERATDGANGTGSTEVD
jgi:CRISPR-associated endonuclease/helicase Cas3